MHNDMNTEKTLFTEAKPLEKEDYQHLLAEKQRELAAAIEANAKLLQEKNSMAARAMTVHEENRMLQASPDIAARIAEMDFHLRMAKHFVESGAFPKMTPEQAYTVMKAGAEMGMAEVESLNSLYIINGAIKPHGKGMVKRLMQFGYRVEYLNETDTSCEVRAWNGSGFDVTEKVSSDDPILKRSNFMKLSPRYKMRYHGIRAIINFHLAHIYGSVSDMFASDAQQEPEAPGLNAAKADEAKERARIERHIETASDIETLQMVAQYVGPYQLAEEYESKFTELSESEP